MTEPHMVEIPLVTLKEILLLLHDGISPKVTYGSEGDMLKAAYDARGWALWGASSRLNCFIPPEPKLR